MIRCGLFVLLLALASGSSLAQTEFHPKIPELVEIKPPFPRMVQYRATIANPLEEHELREIAAVVQARIGGKNGFGLSFVLPGWPDGGRVEPHDGRVYASRLVCCDRFDDFYIGTPASKAAKLSKKFVLRPGESVAGIWVDHYLAIFGVMALTQQDGKTFYRMAEDGDRLLLKDAVQRNGGSWLEAVEMQKSNGENYEANGKDSVRRAVLVGADGTLRYYQGGLDEPLASKPLRIAKPWKE